MTLEDETGEVEDVRLTYTYIRLDDGRRLIVPNEKLASNAIANHTSSTRASRLRCPCGCRRTPT